MSTEPRSAAQAYREEQDDQEYYEDRVKELEAELSRSVAKSMHLTAEVLTLKLEVKRLEGRLYAEAMRAADYQTRWLESRGDS